MKHKVTLFLIAIIFFNLVLGQETWKNGGKSILQKLVILNQKSKAKDDRIDSMENLIDSQQNEIKLLKESLVTKQTKIDALENNQIELKSQIENLEIQMANNTDSIEDNTVVVSTNTADVSNNTLDISSIKDNIVSKIIQETRRQSQGPSYNLGCICT